MQMFNWFVFMYSLVLAFWLLMTVFYGRQMNQWSKTQKIAFEVGGHAFVFVVAMLFTGLPFIGYSYGRAGLWCWIRLDNEYGLYFQLFLYYVPVWVILFLIAIMYLVSLIHGMFLVAQFTKC